MNLWGKLIGTFMGYLLGGPVGAIFGLLFGHFADQGFTLFQAPAFVKVNARDLEAIAPEFFTAVFSVMGSIAKADEGVKHTEPKSKFRRGNNKKSKDKKRTGAPQEKRNLERAFAILNVAQSATNDDIVRAYRRLTSRHHPDKLIAKGMPDEVLKVAEAKTREIRKAYDHIRAVRNF